MIRVIWVRNPNPTSPRDLYRRTPFLVNAKLLGEMLSLGLMSAAAETP